MYVVCVNDIGSIAVKALQSLCCLFHKDSLSFIFILYCPCLQDNSQTPLPFQYLRLLVMKRLKVSKSAVHMVLLFLAHFHEQLYNYEYQIKG